MGTEQRMRVFVEFARELDAHSWARRYARGLAPDATPYGLHLLAQAGCDVRFRAPLASVGVTEAARTVRRLAHGLDILPAALTAPDPLRRQADVVLCMDEDAGIPAALTPGGPPVVSGVAWLEDARALPWPQRLAAKAGLARMAGVFTQCSAMVEPLVTGFGVPVDKIHTVRLGIDADYFTPAPWPQGPPMVFSVGDDRMRDHDTLVAAMHRVHQHDRQVRFELATTLPVRTDPRFTQVHARRMDEAVRGCYARAGVVAVALHPTGQGSGLTVILEAMASGRPLVVTDNPGLSDYVRHGETGLLVPAGDQAALAAAISSLTDDPQRARQMGRRGRAAVESLFTSRAMASDLRAVLDNSLARHAEWSAHRRAWPGITSASTPAWARVAGNRRPLRQLTRPGRHERALPETAADAVMADGVRADAAAADAVAAVAGLSALDSTEPT